MPGHPSYRVATFVDPEARLAAVGGSAKSAPPEGKRKEKRKKREGNRKGEKEKMEERRRKIRCNNISPSHIQERMAPELFRNQNYKLLKKELIKDGRLFTDVEFPPSNSSIYFEQSALGENVEWKRPGDLVKNPRLFVEGISYNDVTQGILGNCWFVAACAALTRHKTLWSKVIPEALEQEWDKNKPERYCGIFHFCFWRFGHWVDVVIDDLLPTRNGELIFARSTTLNEFWSALLEKAFAKLNGSYESLAGGTLTEAFVDITGGVPETIALKSNHYVENQTARSELFQYLKEACDLKALIAAAIVIGDGDREENPGIPGISFGDGDPAKTSEEVEQQLDCGLVKGHSYAISAIKRLALDANHTSLMSQLFSRPEKIMMVRLQNPWGEKEWNGPWSD
uniref:Calpain catalytic domain-containing protein n=1 Tax=Romanomermis culicivorax TaxID=13658 RepID=A0A915KDW4_ROMCU